MKKEIAKLGTFDNEIKYNFFLSRVDDLFSKYLNQKVVVKGYNVNWNKDNISFDFILEDTKQILTELINTETDYSFTIYQNKQDDIFTIITSNHDCTSKFILEFNLDQVYFDDFIGEYKDITEL